MQAIWVLVFILHWFSCDRMRLETPWRGVRSSPNHYQKPHRRRFPGPGSFNFFGCIFYGPYFKIQLSSPVADGQGRCQNLAPAAEVQRAQEIKRQSQALLV